MYRRTPTSRNVWDWTRDWYKRDPTAGDTTPFAIQVRRWDLLTHSTGLLSGLQFRRGQARSTSRWSVNTTKRRRQGVGAAGGGWKWSRVLWGFWWRSTGIPRSGLDGPPGSEFCSRRSCTSDSQRRLLDGVWIVQGVECHTKPEMAARVGDECCCDLLRLAKRVCRNSSIGRSMGAGLPPSPVGGTIDVATRILVRSQCSARC